MLDIAPCITTMSCLSPPVCITTVTCHVPCALRPCPVMSRVHYDHVPVYRYGELLALAEDLEDMRSTRVLRAVPSRRASQVASARMGTGALGGSSRTKKMLIDDSESSEESSDVRLFTRCPQTKMSLLFCCRA